MAGVLEFTLGLKANEFLSELGVSARELLSFATIAEGARMGFEKMWGAVEKGAQLQALANRTRESAGSMYELEQGLNAVGVSSDAASGMMIRIQRALTGVTLEGENAQAIFGALGLRMRDLKQLDPAHQLEAIAAAFSRMDKNAGAALAQGLFGREGAGNILQISAAVKDFAAGIESSSRNAAVWNRSAEAFHQMEVASQRIKEDFSTMWAELVAKAAPAFEKVAAYAEKVVQGFTAAFGSGDVTDLIATAITDGFMAAVDALPAIAERMSEILYRVLRDGAFMAGSRAAEYAATHHERQISYGNFQTVTNQAELANVLAARAQHFKDIAGEDKGVDLLIDKDMAAGFKKAAQDMKPLMEKINKLIDAAPIFAGGQGGAGGRGGYDPGTITGYKGTFTDLEKFGAIMPGIGNPIGQEIQQNIRENTRRTAEAVLQLVAQIGRFGQFGPVAATINQPL